MKLRLPVERSALPVRVLAVATLAWLLQGTPETVAAAPDLDRTLRVGARVAVKGGYDASGDFVARKIEVLKETDEDQELRGRIDSVDPASRSFDLLGFVVTVDEKTRIQLEPAGSASFTDLRPGTRVKVDGRDAFGRRIVARKIKIREDQDYDESKLVGSIENIAAGDRGYATLRVLGVGVVLDDSTDLVGPGGKERPLLRRRLGVVDEDDLLFAARPDRRRRLALAGEVRLKTEVVSNPELDDSPDDSELVPEIFGILGFAADLGPVFAYAEIEGQQEFPLRSEDEFDDGEGDIRFGEVYVQLRRLGVPWLSLAVGRQKFNETREWYYNRKHLDAVRLVADYYPIRVEASISRDLFDETRNKPDQDKVNLMVQATYEINKDFGLEGYFVRRDDRAELPDSPTITGLRLLADPGRRFEAWLDVARETGDRTLSDGDSEESVVRSISAYAYDVGLTYRPRIRLDPTFTLSYAHASGEGDASFDERASRDDSAFRQTGLHRNRAKYNGVVSFRYYGEVIDPELTNLGVLTAGVGLRPIRSVSLDLLYHSYRQDVASSVLVGTDLDDDPLGDHPALGDEWDVALGYEPSRRFELRLTAGRFRPGRAFDADARPASTVRFQAKFRF